MTEPKQPADHPAPEETENDVSHHDPTGAMPNGVPSEATEAEPKGVPSSDRQQTETTAHPDKHSSLG